MRETFFRRLSRWQQLVVVLGSIPPIVVVGTVLAQLVGVISIEQMVEVALGAGETPGTLVFASMFLASPVQWLTGRSQVAVRKYLGVVFYGLAVNNFAMFLVENRHMGDEGIVAEITGSPLLVAGFVALALATPLFVTSSRWSQRFLGMRRWRVLHRLTYVIAVALIGHLILIPDAGPDLVLLTLGFVARVPPVRRRLVDRGARRKTSANDATSTEHVLAGVG